MELGWSQEELAERISTDDEYVRQSEISRIESGRVVLPRRRRLELLAAALNLPLGELLANSGWAGADRAFDHQPIMRQRHRSAADTSGRDSRVRQRIHDQPDAYPSTFDYRPRVTPPGGADADEETAQARTMRIQRIRETTQEIQERFERNRHDFESMRRQFTGSDLRTGTR
jgi:transcriptional regulator with XRE-family HTH domain